ncbi:hypothetical protein, partial [Campylobacter coli]
GDGWRLDVSGAAQHIVARDGQYAEPAFGPLDHAAIIAQPFDSSFLFGRVVVARDWANGLSLVSATGIARLETADTFDATPPSRVPTPP